MIASFEEVQKFVRGEAVRVAMTEDDENRLLAHVMRCERCRAVVQQRVREG